LPIYKSNPSFILALACAAATYGRAQSADDYFHQSVTGAFVYEVKAGPNGGVYSPILNDAPGFSVDYGIRLRRGLMLEAGFNQIVRPIGSSVCCEYAKNADDELFLVPFGARYVFEPRNSRLRLTLGGGGAYLNHTVGNQAGGPGFAGWGGQFVASGDCRVTRSSRLRVGLMARYYFASPKPSVNFGTPGVNPSDTLHIFSIGPEVTISFR
jgi:hypothetical protein